MEGRNNVSITQTLPENIKRENISQLVYEANITLTLTLHKDREMKIAS